MAGLVLGGLVFFLRWSDWYGTKIKYTFVCVYVCGGCVCVYAALETTVNTTNHYNFNS